MTAENRRIRHIVTTRATALAKLRTGLLSWLTDTDEDTLACSPDGTSLRRLARRDAGNLFGGLQRFADGIAGAVGQALTIASALTLSALTGPCLLSIDASSQIAATALTIDNVARKDFAQTFAAGQVFADLATIYKAQSATSTVIPFNLDGNNAAATPARVTYATLAATIRDSTVGALSSRWALQAQRANTLTSVVRGGDLADLCGAGAEGLQVAYGALYMGFSALSDASRNVTAASLHIGDAYSASHRLRVFETGTGKTLIQAEYSGAVSSGQGLLVANATAYVGSDQILFRGRSGGSDRFLVNADGSMTVSGYSALQRARVGNWAGGSTSVLYSRESYDGPTGWVGLLLNSNGRAYLATAAGQALTLQQAGAPSDLATFQDSGVLLNRATTIAGPLKVDTIQGYTTTDEVAIGNTAAVLLLNASNGTSGARFRVAHAQTGSVLYRWQDSVGVTQMTLSPSGALTLAGGLTIGSTERISSTGAGSLTTLGLTGKASLAASAMGAATLNIPAGTAPTSPVDGDVWRDSTGINARAFGTLPTRTALAYPLFTGRRDVTVTTSDTAIIPQIDLPANFWIAGRTVRVRFAIQANLTGSRYFAIKLGSQTILQVQYDPGTWAGVVEFWVVCLSGGASARFAWAGRVDEQTNSFPVLIAPMGTSNTDDGNWTADATGATSISVVQSVASGTRLQTVYFAQIEII